MLLSWDLDGYRWELRLCNGLGGPVWANSCSNGESIEILGLEMVKEWQIRGSQRKRLKEDSQQDSTGKE